MKSEKRAAATSRNLQKERIRSDFQVQLKISSDMTTTFFVPFLPLSASPRPLLLPFFEKRRTASQCESETSTETWNVILKTQSVHLISAILTSFMNSKPMTSEAEILLVAGRVHKLFSIERRLPTAERCPGTLELTAAIRSIVWPILIRRSYSDDHTRHGQKCVGTT